MQHMVKVMLCLATVAGLGFGAQADGAVSLPEGFRRVEYIASAGTGRIDTGIDSRSVYGFEFGLGVFSAANQLPYAGGGDFYFQEYNTTPYDKINCCVRNSTIASNKGVRGGNAFNDLAVTNGVFTINGVQNGTYAAGNALSTSAGNVCLFAKSASTAGRSSISYARIYDADGGLLRDFVPVLDADGRPGFYDTVSNECCYAAATTDLVAGPVVNEGVAEDLPPFVPAETMSVDSYVQNGLVTEWDAIDNAGVGLHDPDTNVWKDLKGALDLNLNANGFWRDDALEVRGFAGVATNAARAYRTVEVVCRLYIGSDSLLFTPGIGDSGGNGYSQTVYFMNGGKECRVANPWSSAAKEIVYPKFDPGADLQLAAVFGQNGLPDATYTNGVNTGAGAVQKQLKSAGCGKASVGGWSSGTEPAFGRIYAIRLYDKILSDEELAYNAAVDAVRFEGKSPAEAFTGNLRWNAETSSVEERIATSLVAGSGTFKVNGTDSAEAWVAIGETVTVTYVPAEGEVPLSWSGVPYDATVSDDMLSVTFAVRGGFAPKLQLKTVLDDTGSLIADGGFEDGAGYAYDGGHQNGWAYRWSRSGDRCALGRYDSGDPKHGFAYVNNYQSNNAQQNGVVIPAGDYVLAFDYAYAPNTPFDLYLKVIDSKNVTRTLASLVTDVQRDGTAWHTVEVPVHFDEDDVYTFRVGSEGGGNNYVNFDNVRLVSRTDLRIDAIPGQPYLGEQVCPPVVVRDVAGNVLVEGSDYELQWGANGGAGNGYVAAVGKGAHYGVAGANFIIGKPIYVTPEGVSTADGTNWATAVDFATALAKASSGYTPWEIWVAGSNVMTAAATVRRFYTNVRLRGGFVGTEATPDEREAGALSVLDGAGLYDVMNWKGFPNTQFERFRFMNCPGRVLQRTYNYQGGVTLEDCVFENDATTSGSAVYLNCAYSKEKLVLRNCRFRGAAATGASNYAGGAAINMTAGAVEATGCEFTDYLGNGKAGSVVYLAGADSGSFFDHCLFRNNTAIGSCVHVNRGSVGAAVGFDHCTFAFNEGYSSSSGIGINGAKGTITVRNSIFFGNSNGASSMGADVTCGANAPCDLDFSLLEANDMTRIMLGNADSSVGGHILTGDPLFVSEDDVHLLSEAGYFDATGGVHYAAEGVISPAIDGGDPAASFANEPDPNGGRVNLGYYGNTAEASYSLFGADTPSDYPHLTIRKISAVTAVGCTVSYRIDFTDPVDLFICYGEDPDAPAHTNVITSAARIGTFTITGLDAGIDYFVKLYARAADGRDGDCEPVPFTTVSIGSQSYVREGLVFQLDGFDNVARGVHASDTNVWNDLVGNCPFFLTENGSFGDSWLEANGLSAAATNRTPLYRTVEVLVRMTDPSGQMLFANGADNLHVVKFINSGSRCNFSCIHHSTGNAYLPLTYLATVDRCITATYRSDSLIAQTYLNGSPVNTPWDSGGYSDSSCTASRSTLGASSDGTGPWYGRIYAIRLYNRTLTDEEVKLNGAVDMVRYQQADPETAFSGDFRWNTATRKIEAHCSFATDGGEGGSFTVNGVEASDVWLPVGGRVELLYTSGPNEQRPLEWHGLPTTSVISNDLKCVAFDVTAAVNATLQISRAGDPGLALNADGGLEEGSCYVHPSGYNVQTWTTTGSGGVSCHSPNNERQGHCYHRPYQTNGGLSQSGLVIPAGDYILSYQYKCDTSGTVTSFGITGTNGVATTLASMQSDSQRDGSAWHSAEVDVSIPETGIYSLWFKNTSGGNCYSSIDNVYLTSRSDLTMDEVPNQPYLGEQVRPPVTVRNAEGTVLTEGVDYEVSYGRNDGSGTCIGFVAAVGKGDHYGVVGRNFRSGTPIYVTPEGQPGNEGTDWTSAVDFATALAKAASGTSKAWEIWVAGSNAMTAAAVECTTSKNLMVRGGFAGDEATPDERPDGALSVLDGQGLYEIARHKNLSHVEYERILFANAPVRAVTKTGFAGDVKFDGCVFTRNGGEGGGATAFAGWRNDGGCDPKATAVFTGCIFTENASASGTAVNGGGVNASTMNVTVEDCLFLTNGISGTTAYQKGAAIYTTLGTVRVRRSEFRGNVGRSAGGIVQVEGVSKDSSFANCLFIGNREMTSALTLAPDSISRKAEVVNCTFAYNEGCSASAAAGLQASVGQVRVWNSIFYGNANGETNDAADLRGGGSSILDVGYTLFGSDSSESYFINNGASLAGGTCAFADPLFVSETDAHLQSEQGYFDATGGVHKSAMDVRSPGIDAGDPTFPVGDEQMPNGEIVNLGAYGGTRYASLTPVADPEIAELAVEWDAEYTQPTVRFTAGGTGSYGADVTVYVSTDGGESWAYVSDPIGGITKGTTKALRVPLYFPEGSKIWVRADIHGAGKTVPSELEEVDVEGKLPPWYGKKGPANVIHVRPGATGLGDGTSWTDAIGFADALALVTEDRNEIWIAGTNLVENIPLTWAFEYPLKIRGGFTGVECAAAERTPGVKSVLDGGDLYDILLFSNKKPVLIERLVFTRGANRGMKKTGGDGDLTVVDCVFAENGAKGDWGYSETGNNSNTAPNFGGGGAAFYGTSAAKLTVTNCRFEKNTTDSSRGNSYIGSGGGAFVKNFGLATIADCAFSGNTAASNHRGSGVASGLGAYGTRLIVTNSMFECHGNEYVIGTTTMNASGPSRFVNCRFTGNTGSGVIRCVTYENSTTATPVSNEFESCTFAYNSGTVVGTTASTVRKAIDNQFHNCILWSNKTDIALGNALCSVEMSWSLIRSTNVSVSAGTVSFGAGIITNDPQFVTTAEEAAAKKSGINVHLRGGSGYVDERTGVRVGRYVGPNKTSSAVDAGDPAVKCTEPKPNGRRVNLGAYGNTPWATMSPAGTALIVR